MLGKAMDSVSQLKTALGGRYEIDREIGRGGMATAMISGFGIAFRPAW